MGILQYKIEGKYYIVDEDYEIMTKDSTAISGHSPGYVAIPIKDEDAHTTADENPVEMVLVPKEAYEYMQKQMDWLDCLEAAGVDNWSGISYAYEMLEEEQD